MSRSSTKYTKEFKTKAIRLALKSSPIANTAKELSVPEGTLHGWIHVLKKKGILPKVDVDTGKDMAAISVGQCNSPFLNSLFVIR